MVRGGENHLVVQEVVTLQLAGQSVHLTAPRVRAEEEDQVLVEERVDVEGDGVEGGGGTEAAGHHLGPRLDRGRSPQPGSEGRHGEDPPRSGVRMVRRVELFLVPEGGPDVGHPGDPLADLAPVEAALAGPRDTGAGEDRGEATEEQTVLSE